MPSVLSCDCSNPQIAYILFFVVLNVVGKFFMNAINISLSHTVHDKEIWGICKEYVGGWYAGVYPRYGAGSIPQVLQVGHTTDRRAPLSQLYTPIVTL